MVDRIKHKTSQFFNFAEESYLERTSRPIYGLVFLLPFIVFYEVGTLLVNTDVLRESQVRVVAFVWLQEFLEYIGLGGKFAWAAPPLVVIVILLALQFTSHKKWRFRINHIWPMWIESVLLAVPLIVLSLLLNTTMSARGGTVARGEAVTSNQVKSLSVNSVEADTGGTVVKSKEGKVGKSFFAEIITGIGAGIYEELVFRLILISVLMIFFQDLVGLSGRNSVFLAVLISAALFSAHHHLDFFTGEKNGDFVLAQFVFRTLAGVYFAILFAVRGFGITAGAHAFYDIIATTINAVFFAG